jgi:hypothetical protein
VQKRLVRARHGASSSSTATELILVGINECKIGVILSSPESGSRMGQIESGYRTDAV